MEQQMQEVRDAMLQMQAQLTDTQQRLAGTETRQQASEAARASLEATVHATTTGAAAGPSSSVDTRTLGKPNVFSGSHEMWHEWRFKAEAFIAATHPGMPGILENAERRGE